MTKKTPNHSPRPRTTLALRGTTSTPKLQLDHRSHLAAEWARRWLQHGPGALGLDPLTSGTIRRALAVYVEHLSRPDLDAVQEARAVRNACSATPPDPQDQQAAWKRLEAGQQGQPFPTFRDVLRDPRKATDWAAFHDRVDALVGSITTTRNPRKSTP